MPERVLTTAPHGHVLTNHGVWSPDSRWIVYDVRSTPDGAVFDGSRIERVNVETGCVKVLHEASGGACCGVATCCPTDGRVVFIHGPERPTAGWSYGPARRRGVIVDPARPGSIEPLDARDLVPPFTPGALRGGTHVHTFSGDGRLVASTYEDAVLDAAVRHDGHAPERNLRGIAVSVVGRPVRVPRGHPRNHDGTAFTVLVTRLHDTPRPGSDAIERACEEGWVGTGGYLRADGSRQRYALAFQGTVRDRQGRPVVEAFVVDLPDEPAQLEVAGDGPLAGTPTTRPSPPAAVRQRRLTFTTERGFPGLAGPRHWLRSSPDGSVIACLMRDDAGMPQLFTVSPLGGPLRQLTCVPRGIASAFSFSPTGDRIACVCDASVCTIAVADGALTRLTEPTPEAPPRPEACVFSPDGTRIAFARVVPGSAGGWTQVCVVDAEPRPR
jgi:hypothetical protein